VTVARIAMETGRGRAKVDPVCPMGGAL
jgi:hypothetical protein